MGTKLWQVLDETPSEFQIYLQVEVSQKLIFVLSILNGLVSANVAIFPGICKTYSFRKGYAKVIPANKSFQ